MTLPSDNSIFVPWDCCKLVQFNYCTHLVPQCFMRAFCLPGFLFSVLPSLTHDMEIQDEIFKNENKAYVLSK